MLRVTAGGGDGKGIVRVELAKGIGARDAPVLQHLPLERKFSSVRFSGSGIHGRNVGEKVGEGGRLELTRTDLPGHQVRVVKVVTRQIQQEIIFRTNSVTQL